MSSPINDLNRLKDELEFVVNNRMVVGSYIVSKSLLSDLVTRLVASEEKNKFYEGRLKNIVGAKILEDAVRFAKSALGHEKAEK